MSESTTSGLAAKLSKLNPFNKIRTDSEDLGDTIESDSVGGGGRAHRKPTLAKEQLRVSHAIKDFLAKEHILSEDEAGLQSDESTPALKVLLNRPHIRLPPELIDRSHPLTEYYISSSHNSYLMGNQLYGMSDAAAYEKALGSGSRCVEIDAWDNEEEKGEVKVTHGLTLNSHIPFRSVCSMIKEVMEKEASELGPESGRSPAPILISLENHCSAQGQLRLVEDLKEILGGHLLSEPIHLQGTLEQQHSGEQIALGELGFKVAMIIEYKLPKEAESEASSDEGEDEEVKRDRATYKEKKKQTPAGSIIPELADLGVYAQSVKPIDDSWFESKLKHGPHHHLINLSESGLATLIPAGRKKVAMHNSRHLMRVYPKGTRITSKNLNPVPFWGVGAQICALNWQTFDHSMQLNEALFADSDGYILKPSALRAGGSGKLGNGRQKKLRVQVAGATAIPVPSDRDANEIKPYVTCTLVHPDNLNKEPPKRKTAPYKQHKLGIVHKGENPPPRDPLWNEILEWEFDDNELVFLRILVKSDDKFAKNPVLAVAAVRLTYLTGGWSFVRMLDLKGRETECSILINFETEDL